MESTSIKMRINVAKHNLEQKLAFIFWREECNWVLEKTKALTVKASELGHSFSFWNNRKHNCPMSLPGTT